MHSNVQLELFYICTLCTILQYLNNNSAKHCDLIPHRCCRETADRTATLTTAVVWPPSFAQRGPFDQEPRRSEILSGPRRSGLAPEVPATAVPVWWSSRAGLPTSWWIRRASSPDRRRSTASSNVTAIAQSQSASSRELFVVVVMAMVTSTKLSYIEPD